MTMQHMRLDIGQDGIALLTLDQQGAAANVISDAWMTEFSAVLDRLDAAQECRGLIVVSAKPTFLAGADLAMLDAAFPTMTLASGFALSQQISKLFRRLELLGKPVAAVIEGAALGGGFELGLACHRRFLLDDAKAVVGLPEVQLGLLPGAGGTQRLGRMLGSRKAGELLLSGRSVRPAEALELGLVDELFASGQGVEAAKAWIASGPDATKPWDRKGFAMPESRGLAIPEVAVGFSMATAAVAGKAGFNMPAPVAILSCLFEGLQLPFDRGLAIESKYFARLLVDPVARNLIRTTFLGRNAALKGARRPADVPRRDVRTLGVVGAGLMGCGIASAAAQAGIAVVLVDRDQATAEGGKARVGTGLEKLVAKGRLKAEQAETILARVSPTADFATLAPCELVIEAVFEDAAIKAETLHKVEAVIAADAIYATNTSTLPITGIAGQSMRPDQVIGLHFFSPVELMELVEVVMGRQTSPVTLAAGLDFLRQIRKLPIVVNDGRGFYTSRVVQRYIIEGAAMLAEGVEPARIENAGRSAGYPVGPLALLDEVAIDLAIRIVDQAIAQEGDAYEVPPGVEILRRMKELGRLGRKTSAGFYEYDAPGGKRLWPGLAAEFPVAAEQPDSATLKERYLYAQALESARCVDDGIIEHAIDADLGSIFGIGYPAWTGGALGYIDTVGVKAFVTRAEEFAARFGPRFTPPASLRAKAEAAA